MRPKPLAAQTMAGHSAHIRPHCGSATSLSSTLTTPPHSLVSSPPQVIGRQKEVVRISQILGRKKKNNPILLGEPGVGKTAIAEVGARPGNGLQAVHRECARSSPLSHLACTEQMLGGGQAGIHSGAIVPPSEAGGSAKWLQGLARAIVTKTNADGSQLPDFLVGKRLLQLDVGLLIAGAKVRMHSSVGGLAPACRAGAMPRGPGGKLLQRWPCLCLARCHLLSSSSPLAPVDPTTCPAGARRAGAARHQATAGVQAGGQHHPHD